MSLEQPTTNDPSAGRSRRVIGLLVVCVAVIAIVVIVKSRSSSPVELLTQIDEAVQAGNQADADRLSQQLIEQAPESDEAFIVNARLAASTGNIETALDYYKQLADYDGAWAEEVLDRQAKLLFESGRLLAAEACLRGLLKRKPNSVDYYERLFNVLRISGRNWELQPLLFQLLKRDHVVARHLLACAVPEQPRLWMEDTQALRAAYDRKDPLGLLSAARESFFNNDWRRGLPLVRQVVDQEPLCLEAQARLGLALLDAKLPDEFREWHLKLPAAADGFPLIWYVRGLWIQQKSSPEQAAYCFLRALELNPNHTATNHRMASVLLTLERDNDAAFFAKRASRLAQLEFVAPETQTVPERIPVVIEALEELGRLREARAWCQVVVERGGDKESAKWARLGVERISERLKKGGLLSVDPKNAVPDLELSDFDAPNWRELLPKSEGNGARFLTAQSVAVSFRDVASEAGLKFNFFNGAGAAVDQAYMFEFSGGGVGVLDFDGDDWPDIYLTQGCEWPAGTGARTRRDRLFRNLGNGEFEDVTLASGLENLGYGQGVAVGDFNNDGFPDLYVANIGNNRLFENNGDGTFQDVTEESGIAGATWTASCLVADLNGDTWPDLYDVNYLGGSKVFTQKCGEPGERLQCSPTDFPGEQDRVYLNQQDGTFRDVTASSGIQLPDGKGMGIVAADFDGSRRLSLFIANDTTPNFYFVNETLRHDSNQHDSNQTGNPELKFSEKALLSGLALNESGQASSCMGIATGDANLDGNLDLFVTNFQLEPNSLFIRQPCSFYIDSIQEFRVRDSGYNMEGWGAQFLDADLDGYPDLLVANGHLDNYGYGPIKNSLMRPQFLANINGEYFLEADAKKLGPFFEKKKLGRAVALLDWNRDGLEDACMTHVHEPVALLSNTTAAAGHFVAIQLRGVNSSRDAIGTTVEVKSGDQTWKRQLVAGDGFSASNERQLIFGLGDRTQIDSITVHWTRSKAQTYEDVEGDHRYIAVEGQAQLRELPVAQPRNAQIENSDL